MTSHELSVALGETEEPVDFGRLEHRPCICGGEIYRFVLKAEERWICDQCCGAAGKCYEEAIREKIILDTIRNQEKTRHFLKKAQLFP